MTGMDKHVVVATDTNTDILALIKEVCEADLYGVAWADLHFGGTLTIRTSPVPYEFGDTRMLIKEVADELWDRIAEIVELPTVCTQCTMRIRPAAAIELVSATMLLPLKKAPAEAIS